MTPKVTFTPISKKQLETLREKDGELESMVLSLIADIVVSENDSDLVARGHIIEHITDDDDNNASLLLARLEENKEKGLFRPCGIVYVRPQSKEKPDLVIVALFVADPVQMDPEPNEAKPSKGAS